MYEVKMTKDELDNLFGLIDVAVKALGLQAVDIAKHLRDRLGEARLVEQKVDKKEKVK